MSAIFDKNIVNDTPENEGSPPQWQPYPIECLPTTLREYCKAASRSTQTDVAYTATLALPVLASAVGTGIVLQVNDDWSVPAIIWGLLLAVSGSGKSPALKCAVKPLLVKQQEYNRQFDDAMAEYEEALSDWKQSRNGDKPVPPKHRFCHLNDCTTPALIEVLADNNFGVCGSYGEAMTWLGSLSSNGKDEALCFADCTGSPHCQRCRR
jgi:hypothetical protein